MSRRAPRIVFALVVLAAAGCFNSKPDDVSGGGGVETTEGNLASLAGSPAGARVSLIPVDFDPLRDTFPDSLTVLADAKGDYHFRGLASGLYNLEAYLPTTGSRCFRPGVEISKGDKNIPGTDTLVAPGRLRLSWDRVRDGVLTQNGRNFRVDLTGVETDSGGIFIDSLPAGLLPPFSYMAAAESVPVILTDSVLITAGTLASVPIYSEWAHSAILKWNATSIPPDGLEGYPLLVRLTSPEFPFGEASSGGSDIRFTTMDGDPLPHAVDSWDSAAGHAEIWVRLKAQPGGGFDSLRMDWGRATSAPQGGSVFDSASGFAGVWHLGPPASGEAGFLDDAGPFALRTSAVALVPEPLGLVGAAQLFDGVGGYAQAASGAQVNKAMQFFISAWIAPDTTGLFLGPVQSRTVLSKWEEADSTGFILYYMPHYYGVTLKMGFGMRSQNFDLPVPREPEEKWHLIAATYDTTGAAIWWDGKELLRFNFGPESIPANNRDILIGARASANPDTAVMEFFRGRIDEARVLLAIPPKEWLELDYQTQKPGANIVTFEKLK